ncbi:hypothetical protein [Cupriavidus plantarum]|uniref:hypothetical protein n=1 Tax=Cupriavidus plantarum TaxID=942865 RepID=UPI00339D6C69
MPRFQTFCADVTRLYREHYWLAASCWLPWAALVAAQPPGAGFYVAIIAGCLLVLCQASLSIFGLQLQHRMASQDDTFLSVRLDEIDLGVVPAHEYAAMRYRAAFSLRTYLHQLLNLMSAVKNVGVWIATFVPVVLFWSIVVILLLDPLALPTCAEAMRAMAEVPTSASLAQTILPPLAALVAAIFVLYLLWRPRFLGLRSAHRMAWERELRNRLDLPSTGVLSLYRIRGDAMERVDELQEFRAFWRQRYGMNGRAAATPRGAPQ